MASDHPVTALPPPPGTTSNLADPPTLAPVAIVTMAVCCLITTIPIIMRTYVRAVHRQFGKEDVFLWLSWTGLMAYLGMMIAALYNRAGTHEWDLLKSQIPGAMYWLSANSTTYGMAILCAKLAVLFMYRRVFFVQRKTPSDYCLNAFIAVLVGFYVSITLVKIWACLPREYIWNKSISGTCVNLSVLYNISGFFNTVTDFIILVIPMRLAWKLNMKLKTKILVILVFTFGSIVIGMVVRFRVSSSPDTTYNQLLISLWAGAEISAGLLCVCLPEIPRLFRNRRKNGSSPYNFSASSTLEPGTPGTPASKGSGGVLNSPTVYGGSRGRRSSLIMGKRDLEYGRDLLDDDSDIACETRIELPSRNSSVPQTPVSIAERLPPPAVDQEAIERVASLKRARYSSGGGIMKTVNVTMEITPSKSTGKLTHSSL